MSGMQVGMWSVATRAFGAFIMFDMMLTRRHETVGTNKLDRFYDFIIVGGGSAGATLAGRLAEEGSWKVLLLEAGGEQANSGRIPWFSIWLAGSPQDWKYISEPNYHGALGGYVDTRAWFWRGKVIGGSASINNMLYMRGNKNDYDNWGNLGNEGWSYEECLPYFRKLERMTNRNLASDTYHHGTSGPMVVEDARHYTKLRSAFLYAGKLLGFDIVDQNGAYQTGFAPYMFTINGGFRWTPAEGYLHRGPNLHIALKSTVHKVLFDEYNRAIGVEVNHRGLVKNVYASKEVVLSAGVIASPQLLMLSGVGPPQHLYEHKIPVLVPLPGVGQNLQDHIASYGATWLVKAKGAAYNPFMYTTDPSTFIDWRRYKKGPLAAPVGIEGAAFLSTPYGDGGEAWPDVQVTFASTQQGFDGGATYKYFSLIKPDLYDAYYGKNSFKEGYSLHPSMNRPYSRGNITLRSSSPYDHPVIQPNYLEDYRDIKTLVEGMKIVRRIGDSPAFKKYGSKFYSKPLPTCRYFTPESDEYWECWVRTLATTDHHPVGTCKMGPDYDPYAVVDPRFNVRGVTGLRVVDGSTMPQLVSGNINIPIIMMAERAADFIKQDHLYTYGK